MEKRLSKAELGEAILRVLYTEPLAADDMRIQETALHSVLSNLFEVSRARVRIVLRSLEQAKRVSRVLVGRSTIWELTAREYDRQGTL